MNRKAPKLISSRAPSNMAKPQSDRCHRGLGGTSDHSSALAAFSTTSDGLVSDHESLPLANGGGVGASASAALTAVHVRLGVRR